MKQFLNFLKKQFGLDKEYNAVDYFGEIIENYPIGTYIDYLGQKMTIVDGELDEDFRISLCCHWFDDKCNLHETFLNEKMISLAEIIE